MPIYKKIIIICGCAVLMASALQVFADTSSVIYQAPTEREDSTPLAPAEIAGFNIYDQQGAAPPGICQQTGPCMPSSARSFTVPADGKTLYITTVDTDGRESVYSQPVDIPMGKAKPKPPGGIIINIVIDTGVGG